MPGAEAGSARSERDTKDRIMDAAEALFVEHGAERMSLRAVTARAEVNVAAVNYHFGGKEKLLHAILARRLDPLNDERARLLAAAERRWPGAVSCEHVLAALFVPALRTARAAGPDGMLRLRFLGRAYSDASPATTGFLRARYEPVSLRFLDAFARALPDVGRADLGLRLAFVLRSVAGLIAAADLPDLVTAFGRTPGHGAADAAVPDAAVPDGAASDGGGPDAMLLARLGNLVAGALRADPHDRALARTFARVSALSREPAGTSA